MKMFYVWIALGIACVLYGIIVKSAGSGTMFFAVWLGLGILFFVFAFAAKAHFYGSLPVALKVIIAAAAVFFLAVFVIVEAIIISGFSYRPARNTDYLIVLGAQVKESGPSVVLKYRLDAAAEYLNNNENTVCIVSGGQGYNEPYTEAQVMREYLLEQGIPDERIIVEDKAKDTEQNIRFSMEFFDPKKDSVAVVTNNFHAYRGLALAKKQGIENASALASDSTPLFLPNNMLREFFAVLIDYLRGEI